MNKEELKQIEAAKKSLQKLSKSKAPRKKLSIKEKLNLIKSDINKLREEGFSNHQILDQLKDSGIVCEYRTFMQYMLEVNKRTSSDTSTDACSPYVSSSEPLMDLNVPECRSLGLSGFINKKEAEND